MKDQPSDNPINPASEIALRHADKTFNYIQSLNKLEDSRSQSIILLNGLMYAFLGIFAKEIHTTTTIQSIILTIAIIFGALSIITALRISSSKTKDFLSPIHHTGISHYQSWEDYKESILKKSKDEIISDICRESYIVAEIVGWRGKQVKIAGRFFLVSLFMSITLWIGVSFSLF